MPMQAGQTEHHQQAAQHFDYTETLVDQLVDISNQLLAVAMQLKDGYTQMGNQLEQSMTNLHNETPPGQ